MSLGARATKGGAKGKDKAQDKSKGVDKPPAKEKVKQQLQATTEQMRMANMIDRKSDDTTDVRRMVLELMEMTCRTEEEVCSALHDSDNDMVAACNLLLEESQRIQGEWQTNEKKKKKPPAAAGNGEPEPPREREAREPRERSGAPRPRRGEAESRGRGRGAARGRARGARRGPPGRPRPPRDAERGEHGAYPACSLHAGRTPSEENSVLMRTRAEDWDNEEWSGSLSDTKVFTPSTATTGDEPAPVTTVTTHIPAHNIADSFPSAEHWDNGEWSGSLSDTKVFTPSTATTGDEPAPVTTVTTHIPAHNIADSFPSAEDWDNEERRRARPSHHGNYSYTRTQHSGLIPSAEDWDNEEWSGSLSDTKVFTPSTATTGDEPAPVTTQEECWDTPAANGAEHIPSYSYSRLPEPRAPVPQISQAHAAPPSASPAPAAPAAEPQPRHQPMGMSGSLSAAQSQYLSQLTQQSQRHDNSVYSSNYGVYGSSDITSQRKPQRARVPPPSKIPSSAVEMPGGEGGAMFLDVQFGALEPDLTEPTPPPQPQPQPQPQPVSAPQPAQPPKPLATAVTAAPEPAPAPAHEPAPEPSVTYANTNSMLPESLAPEPVPAPAEPAAPQPNSLEKQLTAAMKQLAVSAGDAPQAAPQLHRHKAMGQQNVYAAHHAAAAAHHPPVYGANVYAPQASSTNASLTSGMSAPAYGSAAALTQYQPMMNSYQTSSSAGVYAGSALYTYQPSPQAKLPTKENTPQYDNSVASSNNSLTSTSTTQSSTAKVATTTVSAGANAGANAANAGVTGAGASAGYGAALYGGVQPTGYHYDEAQLITRTLPHHMGGYYEVGYGVGGAREGTFGLGPTDRFTRTDAASPQQVSQVPAALPPGYAYFYQPPPTTYQYGVYPTYGGGSNVGGVGGVGGVGSVSGAVSGGGKVSSYSQQQPPYDQDSYKPGGGYNASANKAAAGAPPELASAMYAKTHVALNKVNSYEKATFHSGTPPPFGAGSHLYIPAPHSAHHPHHHQHQMDVRVNSSHNRRESGAARAAAKPAASKPSYSQSYWAPN
ncbi:ubiquitin-associated protein 2-like [Leguminivora glycinivorella]|uniref:ubiquitin-associated protein 2-like n=1 Tax=Leguminivora glycinivorella TaxID=1035111 RepID=UPI00200D53BB|nr:ubiquitin-associated protein 2-like [Leguminivora glycinivorella]